MNLLIVDDNQVLSRFLLTFFRAKGHSPTSITDSTEVEAYLDAHECDGLILDIAMPELDGISLIGILRKKHPKLPIVMFTGLGYDEEAMQAALRAGANGYVSKGIGPHEVYTALMNVILHPAGA